MAIPKPVKGQVFNCMMFEVRCHSECVENGLRITSKCPYDNYKVKTNSKGVAPKGAHQMSKSKATNKAAAKPLTPLEESAPPPTPPPNTAGEKPYFTAKERVAYHREQANEAFKTEDKVKAYGHVRGHNRALDQLAWWMRKTPAERDAYIAEKSQKNA